VELQFLQSQGFGTAIVDCRRTNRLIFYKLPSALIDDEIDNHVQILKMSGLSKVEYGQIFGNFAYLSQTLKWTSTFRGVSEWPSVGDICIDYVYAFYCILVLELAYIYISVLWKSKESIWNSSVLKNTSLIWKEKCYFYVIFF